MNEPEKKAGFWALAAVLLSSIGGASCAHRARPIADLPPELTAYRSWPRLLPKPRRVPTAFSSRCIVTRDEPPEDGNPHASQWIMVYGNPVAAAAMAEPGMTALPVGSVVVKEKLARSPTEAPSGIAVMVKRAAPLLPETGGWEFQYYPTDEAAPQLQQDCGSCHVARAAEDYLFGRYRK